MDFGESSSFSTRGMLLWHHCHDEDVCTPRLLSAWLANGWIPLQPKIYTVKVHLRFARGVDQRVSCSSSTWNSRSTSSCSTFRSKAWFQRTIPSAFAAVVVFERAGPIIGCLKAGIQDPLEDCINLLDPKPLAGQPVGGCRSCACACDCVCSCCRRCRC